MKRFWLSMLILLNLSGGAFATDVSGDTVTATGATTPIALGNRAASTISVLDTGAICNGTTDDSADINNAVALVSGTGGGMVSIPPGKTCAVSSTITLPANVYLVGAGAGSSTLLASSSSIGTMIKINGSFTGVENLQINTNTYSPATAITAIAFGVSSNKGYSNIVLSNLNITGNDSGGTVDGPCIAIDINGGPNIYIDRVNIGNVLGAACSAIGVGVGTTGGSTADVRISNTEIALTPPASGESAANAGMVILDSGGIFVTHTDIVCPSGARPTVCMNFGTQIAPQANQYVVWSFFHDTALGDVGSGTAFEIDTGAASAIVEGFQCNGCWTASSKNSNIIVNNSNAGSVNGIHFVGLRDFNAGTNGVENDTGPISDLTFDASTFCGNSATSGYSNIYVNTAINGLAVRNTKLGGSCENFTTTPAYGIDLAVTGVSALITGNDFTGVTTALAGPPFNNSVVANNAILDNQTESVASSASITIHNYPTVFITGTTSISNISDTSGADTWAGRTVRFITLGSSLTFSNSGTVSGRLCNGFTATANSSVTGWYTGGSSGCWYLH